jgi:hypothetical protein
MTPASEKRFRQFGKKLMQANMRLIEQPDAAAESAVALIRRGKTDKIVTHISAALFADWLKADVIMPANDTDKNKDKNKSKDGAYVLSAAGRAHLRRHMGGDFTAQHQADIEAGDETRPRQLAATPLQLLQAHGRSKAYGLNDCELEAGGRLHDDFHSAMRVPHQTMDWSRPVYVDGGGQDKSGDIPVSAVDAQKRVVNALAYIGPGLADMAVDVCCSELGLEATEKKFALPRRSAKIMLKLALMRLAVHYGYQSASAAAASFRMR